METTSKALVETLDVQRRRPERDRLRQLVAIGNLLAMTARANVPRSQHGTELADAWDRALDKFREEDLCR